MTRVIVKILKAHHPPAFAVRAKLHTSLPTLISADGNPKNRNCASRSEWKTLCKWRDGVSAWRQFSDGITPTDTVFIRDKGLIDVPEVIMCRCKVNCFDIF